MGEDPHLKLLEHYVSVQGEGPRVGQLTQFVRFAGCNMRCEGWPCDTQHAIQPALYIGKYEKMLGETIASRCHDLRETTGALNVCLTGGEPMMQSGSQLEAMVDGLEALGFTVEMFSNGSFLYGEWALRMKIMMDWKLPGSGESTTELPTRTRNAMNLSYMHGIKFVVCDQVDLNAAHKVTEELLARGCKAKLWVTPAWGRIDPGEVVQYMILHRMPWHLSLQVHKYVWDPEATLV